MIYGWYKQYQNYLECGGYCLTGQRDFGKKDTDTKFCDFCHVYKLGQFLESKSYHTKILFVVRVVKTAYIKAYYFFQCVYSWVADPKNWTQTLNQTTLCFSFMLMSYYETHLLYLFNTKELYLAVPKTA